MSSQITLKQQEAIDWLSRRHPPEQFQHDVTASHMGFIEAMFDSDFSSHVYTIAPCGEVTQARSRR